MFTRRLRNGKATVSDLISAEERGEFAEAQKAGRIVIYDESSKTLAAAAGSVLVLFFEALEREAGQRGSIYFIEGGYAAVEKATPELCETTQSAKRKGSISLQFLPPPPPTASDSAVLGIDGMRGLDRVNRRLQQPPTAVMPYLYLGAKKDASNADELAELGIKFILNCTTDCPNYHESSNAGGLSYYKIEVLDTWGQSINKHFVKADEFIEKARTSGGKVLVHCNAGISRSATIVIAYLMKKQDWSLDRAYSMVRSKRPQVSPHVDFYNALQNYERILTENGARLVPASPVDSPNACSQVPLQSVSGSSVEAY